MEDEAARLSATERLNAGEDIPRVDPLVMEAFWNVVSKIPRERRGHTAIGVDVFWMPSSNNTPPSPEQRVAFLARYALLDALLERGFFAKYMEDESQRQKVFCTAANFPCNKDDLGEAFAERLLRDSAKEQVEQTRRELQKAGYDPNHLRVLDKFREWMQDNC